MVQRWGLQENRDENETKVVSLSMYLRCHGYLYELGTTCFAPEDYQTMMEMGSQNLNFYSFVTFTCQQ